MPTFLLSIIATYPLIFCVRLLLIIQYCCCPVEDTISEVGNLHAISIHYNPYYVVPSGSTG